MLKINKTFLKNGSLQSNISNMPFGPEVSKASGRGGFEQTDTQTGGLGDSMTESAQWANSVKSDLCLEKGQSTFFFKNVFFFCQPKINLPREKPSD